MARYRPAVRERLAAGALLVTRAQLAAYAGRHPNVVRRHCRPVACDVPSRQPLYDVEHDVARLDRLGRRHRPERVA